MLSRLVLIMNICIILLSSAKFALSEVPEHNHTVIARSVLTINDETSCPPWFLYDNTTRQCACGDDLGGVVSCDNKEKQVYLVRCYCMTYDAQIGISVGSCFTNCIAKRSNSSFHLHNYLQVPLDLKDLNKVMCDERWNRSGRFCGKCKKGYYPLAYSFEMNCVNCTNTDKYRWLIFVSTAFIPLTVFFILILSFGISANSPQLEAFIIFAQIISTPANTRMVLEALDAEKYPFPATLCRIITAAYGIWNLDFFRTLLPQNCLKITTLQVLALDYVIAVYPLFLIVLTYIVIDLHDRQFCLLAWVGKAFGHCHIIKPAINIKSSILHTFGTFLLLSYGKFLTVSFDLLVFTKAYSPNGKVASTVLFYDASIDYFSKEHLPYAILAITITIIFNIIPLIFLLLHPLKCFKGHIGRWPALRICLDSFQGYYKDGTAGTHDCRFFSSLCLLIRLSLFVAYSFVQNVGFYSLASILLIFLVTLIIVFQPFKEQFKAYNSIYSLLLVNLAVFFITIGCIHAASLAASHTLKVIACAFSFFITILPLFYVSFFVLKWLFSLSLIQSCFLTYCTACHSRKRTDDSDLDESFAQRMEYPGEEQRLIHANDPNIQNSQYGSVQSRERSAY